MGVLLLEIVKLTDRGRLLFLTPDSLSSHLFSLVIGYLFSFWKLFLLPKGLVNFAPPLPHSESELFVKSNMYTEGERVILELTSWGHNGGLKFPHELCTSKIKPP